MGQGPWQPCGLHFLCVCVAACLANLAAFSPLVLSSSDLICSFLSHSFLSNLICWIRIGHTASGSIFRNQVGLMELQPLHPRFYNDWSLQRRCMDKGALASARSWQPRRCRSTAAGGSTDGRAAAIWYRSILYGRFDHLEHIRLWQATVPLSVLFCLGILLWILNTS
jgi:hypothetical protein